MNARNTSPKTNPPTSQQSNGLFLFLIFLFSLPALSPFFTTTPTRSADGLLHLYRLVQLDALWQHGVFFSRWLPDVAYGYGLPLFNYYAPLVYYLTAPLHLVGIPFSLALNVSVATALLVGAYGMFFSTRALVQNILSDTDKFAPAVTAILAALAFLYAPYMLFNATQRANLAEQWALAFAPFALWRFLELARNANVRNWALAIFTFAAVILSHNVTGFLFAPLLVFFSLVSIFSNSSRVTLSAFVIPLSAFFLALGLAAFFLLPALLERDYVQIARVIVTPDFDYRFNFVAPNELFALLPRADTGRLNPSYPNTLGIVQVVLGVVGSIVTAIYFRVRRALPLFFLAVAACGFTFLMLAISQPLWDNITLLSFVQLPMRVRGLVALCLAPFAGMFLIALPARWHTPFASMASIALVLASMPMLYPRYANNVPLNPTLADMFAYEKQTGSFGTTSFGEYLPVWVQELPDKTPFNDTYARNEIPDRFVLPEGVNVCGAQIRVNAEQLCTSAQDSWHAIYRAFYFPGWRVFVNGLPVEITPTPRTGLISFTVSGGGDVRVEYIGTDIEHIAEWVSIASALLILCIVVFAFMYKRRVVKSSNTTLKTSLRPLSSALGTGGSTLRPQSSALVPLFLIAFALITLKIIYLDRVSNPFVAHFDGTHVDGIAQPRNIPIDDGMLWLGYDVSSEDVRRGDFIRVTMYWRTQPGLQKNLSTFVHLVAPDGFVLAQKDSLHPANVPTTLWDTDAYGADEHLLQIPETLAPGVYDLRGGVYDPTTNMRGKTPDGEDFVSLGIITVQ